MSLPGSERRASGAWVVITDVDGCLLDPDTYRYDAARPTLAEARAQRHSPAAVQWQDAGLSADCALCGKEVRQPIGGDFAMALEHLGVGRQVILVSFSILFGGVVFALSLAFGLVGRELARGFLEHIVQGPAPGQKPDALRHL